MADAQYLFSKETQKDTVWTYSPDRIEIKK